MSLSREQLDQYIKVIVMHDVKPSDDGRGVSAVCKQIIDVLSLNFKGQFDTKLARQLAFNQLANC